MLPLLALLLSLQAPDRGVLRFEAEEVTEPNWLEDRLTETTWNLWSTDVDADRKWSGGVVLQSPRVLADRDRPEDGAPVLHTVIRDVPAGVWHVEIRCGRCLAASRDGRAWVNLRETSGSLGRFTVTEGTVEFWIDDRWADPANPGSSYYDFITLTPVQPPKPKVDGWAAKRAPLGLGRGTVAVRCERGAYVSWRLLPEDPPDAAFAVYRRAGDGLEELLTPAPIAATTDITDPAPPDGPVTYRVERTDADGGPPDPGASAALPSPSCVGFVPIALAGAYRCQKVGVGDLDGDATLEYVVKQPSENIDPYEQYWQPSPDTYRIEAYRLDGTPLWARDLGWSIERGIWYSPYLVADLDGDGKAEVAAKTGEGDPRDADGRVQSGPEYLSVWAGATGEEIARVDWIPREGMEGPLTYNYASRNQLAVAYLDGKTPCLLVARGTYTELRVVAYQLCEGRLERLWDWSSAEEGGGYRGQGAHSMRVGDVDADGRDEVVVGSAVIDDNGNGLWSTGLGHPDHCYLGDILPARPGLEIYYGIEPGRRGNAVCLVAADTGAVLWGIDEQTWHVHAQGLCADLDGARPGMECYSGEKEMPRERPHRWLHAADGTLLADATTVDWGLAPLAAYWDADLQRELVLGRTLQELDGSVLLRLEGGIVALADLLGDWREEIVTSVDGTLRIYTTTTPAADRRTTLLADPIYRADVTVQAMGYFQAPTPSRCLAPAP